MKCPSCDRVAVDARFAGPERAIVAPCGHEVHPDDVLGLLDDVATELHGDRERLATDGGQLAADGDGDRDRDTDRVGPLDHLARSLSAAAEIERGTSAEGYCRAAATALADPESPQRDEHRIALALTHVDLALRAARADASLRRLTDARETLLAIGGEL